MTWFGKALGGAFGFMLGGPLGGLIGVALGHNFDQGAERLTALPPRGEPLDAQERTQTAFFTATFSVLGYLAKADGQVTRDEIRLASQLMEQMQLSAEYRRLAQRLFNEGKSPGFPLDEVLEQFRAECRRSRNLIGMFVEILIHAAYADGVMHQGEREVLIHVCARLGVSRTQLHRLETMICAELNFRRAAGAGGPHDGDTGSTGTLEDAYAILGVARDSPDADVKRAYRRLMNQHHPDKLVAKGLPEEMMRLATTKTQEIKMAYDRVKAARASS